MDGHSPANFIADSLGLDFLNSVATSVDTTIDWVDDGEGLLNWLAQAKLAPAEALEQIKVRALPGELDKVADQARALREWFRGFVRLHMGRPLPPTALHELEPLNRLLDRDETFKQLVPHYGADGHHAGHHLRLPTMRRWKSPDTLLLPIGEAMARLVCEENFVDVKACEGESCTLIFADHTRRRSRRWCSMALCGNRAKQAAHRSRLRERSAEEP
jgi:predicted RNA-binding Zn ribbon-like protein